MKLIEIHELLRIGDASCFSLLFENDGKTYQKLREVGGYWQACAALEGTPREPFERAFMRSCLEAERDVAFELFGADWPNHVANWGESNPFFMDCAVKVKAFLDGRDGN